MENLFPEIIFSIWKTNFLPSEQRLWEQKSDEKWFWPNESISRSSLIKAAWINFAVFHRRSHSFLTCLKVNLTHKRLNFSISLWTFSSAQSQSKVNWIRMMALEITKGLGRRRKMCQVENNKSLISIPKLFFSHLLSTIENLFLNITKCQPLHFECDNKWLNVQKHNKYSRSPLVYHWARWWSGRVNTSKSRLIGFPISSAMLKHERVSNWFIILHPFLLFCLSLFDAILQYLFF